MADYVYNTHLVWHGLAQRFVSFPILLLTISLAIVDLFASCALGGGNLTTSRAWSRVIWYLFNASHD